MPNRIVVCPEPLAAAAGAAIFRAGGSAVDAALATAYAQAVVSPAMTTIAGTGSMNLYHAPSGAMSSSIFSTGLRSVLCFGSRHELPVRGIIFSIRTLL
ncbi:MAG TPA: gamma-glutamyltransferase [Casimicrobiaceae bacterium]|nr:gamma-glutamyltransferase [Casimicrobiaceae bacterium]